MSDSILTSVKQKVGLTEEIESFDAELIMLINAELSTLCQLGVGPEDGFYITSKDQKWSDFYTDPRLNFVPTYVALRVWPTFDTNISASVMDKIKEKAQELEWRLNVVAEELAEQ